MTVRGCSRVWLMGVSGRQIAVSRNTAGLISSVSSVPAGLSWGTRAGRAARVRGSELQSLCQAGAGGCWGLVWDTAGRLVKVTRPSGRVLVEVGYNTDGRVGWRRDGPGNTWTYTYELLPAGRLLADAHMVTMYRPALSIFITRRASPLEDPTS